MLTYMHCTGSGNVRIYADHITDMAVGSGKCNGSTFGRGQVWKNHRFISPTVGITRSARAIPHNEGHRCAVLVTTSGCS